MILRLGAAVLVLVALLTWLLLLGTSPPDRIYFEVLNRLDAIALNESLLQRDVLNARAGVLRNYDPLVRHIADMKTAIAELERADAGLDRGELGAMKGRVAAQGAIVERFKTNNAILQNSMSYFDYLSERIASPDSDPRLAVAIGGLANAVDGLARGTNAASVASLLKRLDAIENRGPAGIAPELASFAAHGRTLVTVVPEVDDLMRRLPIESTAANRQSIETATEAFRVSLIERAERYRLALYLVALALLALLVHLGVRLRANALALRRRTDLERLIGDSSNRFLGSQPEDTKATLLEVLRSFAEAVGADRAYVVRAGDEAEFVQMWHRPDAPPPPGWPDAVAGSLAELDAIPEDALHAEWNDPRLPPALRDGLRAARSPFWSSVKLRRGEDLIGLLCFDRTTRWPDWLAGTTSLLRMAGGVIGNALGRERSFREREALKAELQRAQRLETIGTFTSGVAHNFNNILNVMQGHAEIALDVLAEETLPARHLRQSLQAGERAREIVGQILDFGRGVRVERQLSAIDLVVAETVEQLRSATAEPIDLSVDGEARGAHVRGAPAQMEQVLVNLIRNAVQASAPGEPVAVELKRLHVEAPRTLSHGAIGRGAFVRLAVTDRGSGMDGVARARLFDPFFTTKSAGTGLGLATAHEIVRESGGAFDVASAPGRGSRFDVWLPIVSEPDRRPPPAAPTGGVLMVVGTRKDDVLQDEDILAALRFEPVGFIDPDAALAALRDDPERFDLLLVNWRLSGMTGLDFAARACALTRRPVVLAPAATDDIDPESFVPNVVAGVIRRPWQSNMLVTSLREILAKRNAGHASLSRAP